MEQVLAHVRTPLYRNAYALIVSDITTSALGLVYWMLAAHYYPAHQVGLNSTALSLMMLLSGIAQLNLMGALTRFIPVAGRTTSHLVSYAYLSSLLAAAIISLSFIYSLQTWFRPEDQLLTTGVAQLWFALATMLWSIFALQDNVLTGLRQTLWVPLENMIFGVVKIGLLILFVDWFGQLGIFVSWTLPVVVAVILINLLIFRRLIPQHVITTEAQSEPLVPLHIATFVAGDYLGAIFVKLSTALLPALVLHQLGASAAAYFYIAWTIAYSLQLIVMNLAASLTVEAAANQAQLSTYGRQMLRQMARLLVPLVVVTMFGAPYVLRVFGADYTAGTALLRLLALAALPYCFTALYISLARVRCQVGRIIVVQAALCALVLGLSMWWLQQYGITAIGMAWLIAQTLVAATLLASSLRSGLGLSIRKPARRHW